MPNPHMMGMHACGCRELSEGQRKALSGLLLPVDLTPGQELCLHGDPADRFWLLHAGEVQVRSS